MDSVVDLKSVSESTANATAPVLPAMIVGETSCVGTAVTSIVLAAVATKLAGSGSLSLTSM